MARMTGRALALSLALAVSGCSATFENHGYVPPPEDLEAIIVGVDTQSSVEATLGRPSTGGIIRDDTWFYVQSQTRRFGPGPAREIDRQLIAISFTGEERTVANIERFGLERGRVVALSRRVTDTSIRDFGLIQQILRNFGRIDVGNILAGEDG
ncbi:MAG: outer membrane protein assembly factor BamE [Pseudomonadota bacterium]